MPSHRIETSNGSCRIVLEGDLTAAVATEIRGALGPAIDAGARDVEFNLAKAAMLDSTGIGLLIVAGNSLARVQGRLSVTNVSPDIFRMLQSMRLVDRLHASARPA